MVLNCFELLLYSATMGEKLNKPKTKTNAKKAKLIEQIKLVIQVSRPIFWGISPMVFFLGLVMSGGKLSNLALLQMFWLSFPLSILCMGSMIFMIMKQIG